MFKYVCLTFLLLIISGCSNASNNLLLTDTSMNADKNNVQASKRVTIAPVQTKNKQEEKDAAPTDEPVLENSDWITYSNARYGFSIRYPSDWTAAEEAPNGDGKLLYVGNLDVNIRAYGSMYIEGVSNEFSDNLQLQWITLDNGLEAGLRVGYEDDKHVMHLIYHEEASAVEYNFYAKVSKGFFNEHEKDLLKIAKSLDFFDVHGKLRPLLEL